MKQRVDSAQMLLEANVNGCNQNKASAARAANVGCVDINAEIEDVGRSAGELILPSSHLSNWDSDMPMAIKSQEKNKKRMKVEKRAGKGNRKSGSVRTEIHKSVQSAVCSSSGTTTPGSVAPSQSVQTSYLDEPLLQHQNQIFVFSTHLANEAAESVKYGHCKSIIDYHREHPNTKRFLQNSHNYGCSMSPDTLGMMKGQQAPDTIPMTGSASTNWRPHMPEMHDSRMFDRGRMLPNGSYSSDSRLINGCPGESPRGSHQYIHQPMNCRECFHNSVDANNDLMLGSCHDPSDKFSIHVPDDNLTIEQKQHRSKSLAQLTKIHQMLMGDGNIQDGRQAYMGHNYPPGSGMYSCEPRLMNLSHQSAMMPYGGMMHPRGMLSPHQEHMMMSSAYGCYSGKVPFEMNGKGQQFPHDWYHGQREFLDKQQCPQTRGAHMEPAPPPPYYSSVSRNQSAMSEPSSPNITPMRMLTHPHGSHELMVPGMDPDGAGMYGGPTMYRPSHLEMDPVSRMHDYHSHGMPSQRPMVFESHSMLAQEIPPGMSHGPHSPDSSRALHSVHKGHSVGYNGMLPDTKVSDEVTLHRAGNPEHFNPETMGGVLKPTTTTSGSGSKPPPSYAQAQKRKRDEDKDDSYAKGNLQRTPSPTKIDYHLSQFEGQELTITKQLNSSFLDNKTGNCISGQGGCSSLVSGNGQCHFTGHADSPSAALGSSTGSHSNLHQASVNISSPPAISATAFSCGTNIQLNQCDSSDLNNGASTGPHTPTDKPSSVTNITSATLANLAKGVEHLSSQMEQNMMKGGPFHNIQVQGEVTGNNSSSGSNIRSNSSSSSAHVYSTAAESSSNSTYLSFHTGPSMSTESSSALNVNNTYVTTQSSVQNHTSMNSYLDLQRQSISTESAHTDIPLCSIQHTTGLHLESEMLHKCSVPRISPQTNQFQGDTNSITPVPSVELGPPTSGLNHTGLFSSHQPNSSSCVQATHPIQPKAQLTSSPLSNPHLSGFNSCAVSGVESPPSVHTSGCNSSVHIQQKGHNTIQYLPAKPPSSQSSAVTPKCDFDNKLPEFRSLAHTMDEKHSPPSQYFTYPSPARSRSPVMSRALLAATALGPEFANQATIAMHQSASMMRSSSMPHLETTNRNHPAAPHPKTGMMMPRSNQSQERDPHLIGNNSLMVGPDPLMEMSSQCHMKSTNSPRPMLSLPQGIVPGNLECISPIPDMGDCLSTSIEAAQAQAQRHAAMMMQENIQMSSSSPHGHVSRGGPSPHMHATGPISGISMHGPMPQHGVPVSSALGSLVFGQCSYRPQVPIQSPHADMHRYMPVFSNEPVPNSVRSMFPHESFHRLSPQKFISGPLSPRMPLGYMHGLMPSSSLYRHPGMGHVSGQYGIHYPGYPEDFYYAGPQQDRSQQMSGIMGGPRQPY